jgi:hypothetical protein
MHEGRVHDDRRRPAARELTGITAKSVGGQRFTRVKASSCPTVRVRPSGISAWVQLRDAVRTLASAGGLRSDRTRAVIASGLIPDVVVAITRVSLLAAAASADARQTSQYLAGSGRFIWPFEAPSVSIGP